VHKVSYEAIGVLGVRTVTCAWWFTGGDLMADAGSRDGWRKSTRSESGACVEVRIGPDEVQVRHSADEGGRAITFSYREWQAFLEGVLLGEFNLP